ncbi:hypothetical protein E4U25_007181 [Claviceps purpurea]|nr:hypothetical protein E4U12_004228 [Claviceps purpurea]KAG6162916.1 hypothetical protein E4U11_002262 [Claviceps purpurea]KAG6222945.1 hypothetical protein E4U26_004888 [Claviceps purpurea]KAG6230500.1 hypothetical protein E4U25_007181 [Claviceps purpurea]
MASLISAENEWSPLKAVIVGRAEHSAFPSEPRAVLEASMPAEHINEFRSGNPFPTEIVSKAQAELDNFASVLQQHGVKVYRPNEVDWLKVGGYTGSMPRDALMTVGNTLIESPFAWACRREEVELGYSTILSELSSGSGPARICHAPTIVGSDTIYDQSFLNGTRGKSSTNHDTFVWSINNTRPAFDVADFMRLGKTLVGQLSHVTNMKGIEYLRAQVPDGYSIEVLQTTDERAMHLDATFLPLRLGLAVFNPDRVTEEELRSHAVFTDWDLRPCPIKPNPRGLSSPPMYMCSPWLVLNALSLDEKKIFVEEQDVEFANWLKEEFEMEPIMLPFQHVNCLGGSFHCATVDLVRE